MWTRRREPAASHLLRRADPGVDGVVGDASLEPTLLHLIVCDDVQADPPASSPLQRDRTHGKSAGDGYFAISPRAAPRFCVLVTMTGFRGSGELALRIVRDVDQKVIFATRPRTVRLAGRTGCM